MDVWKWPLVGHFSLTTNINPPVSSSNHSNNLATSILSSTTSLDATLPNRHPIFSCSACKTDGLIATGALDGSLRIWQVKSDKEDERDEGSKGSLSLQLVSSMTRHTGAVMSISWHPQDQSILASAGDDATILIWKRIDDATRGVEYKTNLLDENINSLINFQVISRSSGHHQADINGLAWSPDGHLMASVGLDNALCVYHFANGILHLARRVHDAHKGFIKGVTWTISKSSSDPSVCDLILVTCSDDKSCALWRVVEVDSSTVEVHSLTRVTTPFTSSPNSTFFRRCSIDPLNSLLALANTCNGDAPVGMILDIAALIKDNGKVNEGGLLSLVGHVTPIECISFAPYLFYRNQNLKKTVNDQDTLADTPAVNNDSTLLIAMGSQDGTLSVWSSHQERPMVVLDGLFEHSVLDLAWMVYDYTDNRGFTRPSLFLVAVSYDGTVALVKLDNQLTGPFTEPPQHRPLPKLVFDHVSSSLPSTLEQIMSNRDLQPKEPTISQSPKPRAMPLVASSHVKQTVTVAISGKPKRITPQLISTTPATVASPAFLQEDRSSQGHLIDSTSSPNATSFFTQLQPLAQFTRTVYEPVQQLTALIRHPSRLDIKLNNNATLIVELEPGTNKKGANSCSFVSVHSQVKCMWRLPVQMKTWFSISNDVIYLISDNVLTKRSLLSGLCLEPPRFYDSSVVAFIADVDALYVVTKNSLLHVINSEFSTSIQILPLPELQSTEVTGVLTAISQSIQSLTKGFSLILGNGQLLTLIKRKRNSAIELSWTIEDQFSPFIDEQQQQPLLVSPNQLIEQVIHPSTADALPMTHPVSIDYLESHMLQLYETVKCVEEEMLTRYVKMMIMQSSNSATVARLRDMMIRIPETRDIVKALLLDKNFTIDSGDSEALTELKQEFCCCFE